MQQTLYTAITGLKAHQRKMDIIGNNIANVSTTGFKKSRGTFSELFVQTLQGAYIPQTGNSGGVNPRQVGMGTQMTAIDVIHSQGTIIGTGKNTDVAIQGRGFFVSQDRNGLEVYTRDGNFNVDAEGNLVTSEGLFVKGYTADQDGNVNANNGNPQPLKIELNTTAPPKSTSDMKMAGNLFRPQVLKANEAFVHVQGQAIDTDVNNPALVIDDAAVQVNGEAQTSFDAGEFTLNGVSILGDVPTVADDTAFTLLQKMSDLINFHKDATGVIATVKTTASQDGQNTPQAQLALTHAKPGTDREIVINGSMPTIAGTALFSANQVNRAFTTRTANNGTSRSVTAGSITLPSGSVIVNGVDVGPLASTAANNTSEQNAQSLVSLINAKSDVSGVTATTNGNGVIALSAVARDIILSGTDIQDGLNTPAAGAGVSGLFDGMNAAKTASVNVGTTTEVFDALGTRHGVSLDFVGDYDVVTDADGTILGTKDKGTWSWAASTTEQGVAVISSDGDPAASAASFVPHQLNFNSKGVLQDFSGKFTLNFLNSDADDSIFGFNTSLSPNIEQPQPVTVDVGTISDTNGITQFDGPNSVFVAEQNGYSSGELVSFNFSTDGTINGAFSNGQFRDLGRLAVANFANEGGLTRGLYSSSGSNFYQQSINSGPAQISAAQVNGLGTIVGGSLEGSNVDMAGEFTDMIVTQRAFQANSRSITTSDEMLQEVIALKR